MGAKRMAESKQRKQEKDSKSKHDETTAHDQSDTSDTEDHHHHHANRLIDKFMQRKLENEPTETRAAVRQRSLFNLVDRAKDRGGDKKKGESKSKETKEYTWFKKKLVKIKKSRIIPALIVWIVYVFAGAAVIYFIERRSKTNVDDYRKLILEKSKRLYGEIKPVTCTVPLPANDTIDTNKCLKAIYEEMYSVKEPTQNIDCYWDALIYVLTCITTIGYGNLVCFTTLGKMFTVVYGIIGIALTLYVLRNNGKMALNCCNKILNWTMFLLCGYCGRPKKSVMTVTKGLVILFVFWTIGTLFIWIFEKDMWFTNLIYFSFSTFSTVGFGDYTPTTHLSSAIVIALHFIDLSLLSMVVALLHESMENNFLAVLELLDEGYRRHTTQVKTGTENEAKFLSPAQSLITARE